MKLIGILFAFLLLSATSCCNTPQQQAQPEKELIVLAYVTSWSSVMPDPNYITHINYAFGHVNETFDGIMINRQARNADDGRATSEDRLRSIVELKQQKPCLKIMLSIGGWGSGRFSEMAADQTNRLAFAADCKRVIDEFGLDGVDLDWEYPTQTAGGRISASPDDTDNFTLLMRDIRNAIGNDKLLTLASAANARYVDFRAIDPYIDFVNIMTYDINTQGAGHQAGMYRSELTGEPGRGLSCEESVNLHVDAGVPIHKLTLGMPFYGRSRIEGVNNYVEYRTVINRSGVLGIRTRGGEETMFPDFKEFWDAEAMAAYWVDGTGRFVMSYETPRSIDYKCEWLKRRGMLGAMYWDYALDDDDGTLRKAVYHGVMGR